MEFDNQGWNGNVCRYSNVDIRQGLFWRQRGGCNFDEFRAWADARTVAPKSKLGQAFVYLANQWTPLTNYLLDGRLEISNNRTERSIKPFVMGRKNFLFANTPRGAQASVVIYSVIETAKANALNLYRYQCRLVKQRRFEEVQIIIGMD